MPLPHLHEPARPHHYHFAHRVLPTLFHESPARIIQAALKDPLRLKIMWRMAHGMLADAGHPAPALPADGLALMHSVRIAQWSGALLQLPPAERATEAIAVLLLLRHADRPPPQQQAVYATLELGQSAATSAPCAFLCEWAQRDGRPVHLNHGAVDLQSRLDEVVKSILPD